MQTSGKPSFRSFFLGLAALLLLGSMLFATPQFGELRFNPKWYRTYDSTSDIVPEEGQLLFDWTWLDPQSHPDSFYVGIDTLWTLPQDVGGDTAADWDLQVCPDQQCMNGLKADVHGANAPYPFADGRFSTEHHFQFFPAISPTYHFTAPPKSLFGGLMFVRSRSTGLSDTVLGYGAWKLVWDTTNPPPVHPVDGYLPKRSDFVISGDTVHYLKGANAGVARPNLARARAPGLATAPMPNGLRFTFTGPRQQKELFLYTAEGRLLWRSGLLAPQVDQAAWIAGADAKALQGFLFSELHWPGGRSSAKVLFLSP